MPGTFQIPGLALETGVVPSPRGVRSAALCTALPKSRLCFSWLGNADSALHSSLGAAGSPSGLSLVLSAHPAKFSTSEPPCKAWLWYPAKKLKFGGFLDFSSSPQHGAKAGFGAEPLDMAPAPSLPQMLQESSRIKMYPGHCQPSVVTVEKRVDCRPKTAQIGS